ncbi:TrmH family RNA methyltransferase [Virgibacillus sp. W0181]|uniref:TrmH family RNA methyltransferase n=1 Tax=Virgibacillus sp. W0181 TaxID=3391581 RepID=UPI003F479FE8
MITSLQNSNVKQWRKLQVKKERMRTQSFLIEGFHLLEEAWKSTWNIKQIVICEGVSCPDWCHEYPLFTCTKGVFEYITVTETPQGIAAVVEMKQEKYANDGFVILLDRVQDPGNVGTIIRTADAAGYSAVIAGEGTVDIFNDKVVRATQGSLFHLPVVQANLQEELNRLKNKGYTIWATALSGASDFTQVAKQDKIALIVGNEGAGIQQKVLELADANVKIPIYGQAESLNVSVAAGILMYYLRS